LVALKIKSIEIVVVFDSATVAFIWEGAKQISTGKPQTAVFEAQVYVVTTVPVIIISFTLFIRAS
jgi:hypothetical protein